MKKALAGPAKRTAKKKPERQAMIAAPRRSARAAVKGARGTRSVPWAGEAPQRVGRALRAAPSKALAISRRVDRGADRALTRAYPRLARAGARARALGLGAARRLRPVAVLLFRALAALERRLLRGRDLAARAATRASALLTPERATCLAVVAAAGCLLASQFVDYRAVEIDGPAYAGLPGASAPAVAVRTAGQAHAYLLAPVAALAAALALAALRDGRRRGLGRAVFALGLLSPAVALLVDLPAGLDTGAVASRFSSAGAVLLDGFYAELASTAGLMIGGLLLSGALRGPTRHGYRPRRPGLARTQGGRRRARTSGA
jgi:hypothetical protein